MDGRAPRGAAWSGPDLVALELLAGIVALAVVVVVGFLVPAGPTFVDGWLAIGHTHAAWTVVTDLRVPAVVVAGGVVAGALTWPRDRVRALACLVSPPLALVLAELVAKPLSGQTLGGVYSYPSGSTVGAAALGTVAVLATPPRFRTWVAPVALLYGVWMAAAVVGRGWHYPTDAVAGLVFGAGVVAVVDGGLALLVARRPWRVPPGAGPGRVSPRPQQGGPPGAG